MKKLPTMPALAGPPASRFRGQIEAALVEGAAAGDMTLRLTLRDTNLLARDKDTPVADISYAGGVMRFLGVRVEQGGVDQSVLDRGTD